MSIAFLAAALAVTAGWENIDPKRHDPSLPADKVIWRSGAEVELVLKNGAEGTVEARGGGYRIIKTNDRGYMLVKAKPFDLGKDVLVEFRAEVSVREAVPDCSHAFLRASNGDDWINYRPGTPRAEASRTINDGLIQQPRKMYYGKFFNYLGDGKKVYPTIVISGSPSVSIWKNWLAVPRKDVDELFAKKIRPECLARRPKPEVAVVPAEVVARQCAESIDHTAKIVTENGIPALVIDGKKSPPTAFHAVYHHPDFAEITSGQPITSKGVPVTVAWVHGAGTDSPNARCWSKGDVYDAKKAADSFREMMRGDTNSLYMVCFDCNAYPEFAEEHPDEAYVDEDGNPICGNWATCTPGYAGFDPKTSRKWPWISLASPAWRNAIKRNLRAFVAELKRTGHAKKLVGIHFLGYNDGQFGIAYPDYSPCAQKAYREHLAANPGVAPHYFQFCKQLTTLCQNEFAAAFKEAMGKDVVAIRWDDAPFVVDWSHDTMNRDPKGIDITVSQPTYSDRWPGLPDAPYVPWSSLALHGKMHWFELDLRTWWMYSGGSVVGSIAGCGGSPDDAHFRATHRKLAGEMLATRSGFWYYDMGLGWFAGPGIADEIGEVVAFSKKLLARAPDPWKSDVAVVADEEGLIGVEKAPRFDWPSHTYNMCERQLRYMSIAGIPYDYYLARDIIERPALLADKKVVVFIFWRRFDEQRIAAVKALQGRGQTHVFLCESGVLGGAREATGFDVGYLDKDSRTFVVKAEPHFKESVKGSFEQELLRGTDWFGKGNEFPLPCGRRSWVEEAPGVTVHGRFDDAEGKAAIAERRDSGTTRWYVAAPGGLSPEIFQRIVREAGAYQPLSKPGLMVNMNGEFASLHALVAGHYDFRLPFACRVVNVKSGLEEQVTGRTMKLELTAGETCWFEIFRK